MDSVLRNRGLGSPVGATIHGKSILVVGFGELGKETAKLLRGFSPAAVKAFRHGAWADHELELVDEAVRDLHDKPCASVETLTPIGHPSRQHMVTRELFLFPLPARYYHPTHTHAQGSFEAKTPHSETTGLARLVEMAASSDVVIMCCPLTRHTKGILGQEVESCRATLSFHFSNPPFYPALSSLSLSPHLLGPIVALTSPFTPL